VVRRTARRRRSPARAGKAWSDAEDHQLLDKWVKKTPLARMAKEHQRTERAIDSRLVSLGVAEDGIALRQVMGRWERPHR
jgi:hypothetical protein